MRIHNSHVFMSCLLLIALSLGALWQPPTGIADVIGLESRVYADDNFWQVYGAKWPMGEVSYCIVEGETTDIHKGRESVIDMAFSEWNAASPALHFEKVSCEGDLPPSIRIVAIDSIEPVPRCPTSDTPEPIFSDAASNMMVTAFCNSSSSLEHATIFLNNNSIRDALTSIQSTTNPDGTPLTPEVISNRQHSLFKWISLHSIGHALGLAHAKQCVNSEAKPLVMCDDANQWIQGFLDGTYVAELTPDDIQGLHFLYGDGLSTALSVSIASTTTEGHVIQDVGFLSSILGGLPPYQYAWTFDDDGTDSVANPDYTYTTQGVFTPSLTVTDSAGASAIDSLNVMIGEPILKSLQILPLPVSLEVNQEHVFSVTGIFSDEMERDMSNQVAWMSSNPDVATIDRDTGLLTALQAGNTQVWALHAGVESNRVEVTVNPPPPVNATLVRIEIQPPSMMLPVGDSRSFEAIGHYSDGGTRPLTAEVDWLSSNPDVATIDMGTGRLTALRAGNTEVSASKDGFMSNKVNVTVEGSTPSVVGTTVPTSSGTDDEGELRISPDIPPPGISYTHSEGPEPIDFLEVHVTWSNGFEEDVTSRVTWVSGDPSVATIEDSPDEPSLRNYPDAKRLNPKRNGQTTIEVRLEGDPIATFNVEISGFSDEPRSCEELFGSAPGFMSCGSASDSCTFAVDTAGDTCEQMCSRFDVGCLDAMDNNILNEDPCTAISTQTCQTPMDTAICTCTR